MVGTKRTVPEVFPYPDPNSNRLGSGYWWDADGNLTIQTAALTLNLTYGAENQLAQATHSLNGNP